MAERLNQDDVAPTSGEALSADFPKDVNNEKSTAQSQHEAETEDGKADEQPPLPFSRARCVALVATLTGASFLNVTQLLPLAPQASHADPPIDAVSAVGRHYPPDNR